MIQQHHCKNLKLSVRFVPNLVQGSLWCYVITSVLASGWHTVCTVRDLTLSQQHAKEAQK
jgi:hypothetical protein